MSDLVLPAEFRFSQRALEDYDTCPRRFYLRYILHLRWPTPPQDESLRMERMERGARFHRLVQRHLLGLPTEAVQRTTADDPTLAHWWTTYLREAPFARLEGRRYVEQLLSAPLDGHRLMARYDLIIVSPSGEVLIVDWKTNARAEELTTLRRRWQTRLYRYLLVRAGAELTDGHPIAPERITMLYWYVAVPTSRRLPYDAATLARDEADLRRLLAAIDAARTLEDFPATEDERACRPCPFRTWCLGASPLPGETFEEDEDEWESWDFDQIAEIEF